MELEYNENITLLTDRAALPKNKSLKEDEYIALMVTDKYQGSGDSRGFFDQSKEWLGLERTGDKIYITKGFGNYPFTSVNQWGGSRGEALVVRVKDISKCCLLTH